MLYEDNTKRLDDVITKHFIPAITDKCSDVERRLLSLPPRILNLGIPIFSEIAAFEYSNSRILTETLTMKIINQERQYDWYSRIFKITGIRQKCHSDMLKNRKIQNMELAKEIKQHKSRIWSFILDIIFTTTRRKLYNYKTDILG